MNHRRPALYSLKRNPFATHLPVEGLMTTPACDSSCLRLERHLVREGGSIWSDGGLVLLRAAERRLGLAEGLAGCMREWRDPHRAVHRPPAMLRFHMATVACREGCQRLRHPARPPLCKLAVDRVPESGRDLDSRPI